jgi:hypothetical protein
MRHIVDVGQGGGNQDVVLALLGEDDFLDGGHVVVSLAVVSRGCCGLVCRRDLKVDCRFPMLQGVRTVRCGIEVLVLVVMIGS